MVRVCFSCLGIYASQHLQEGTYGYHCPDTRCGNHELTELDDSLADVVVELFRLGIPPKHSCSGHTYTKYFNPYLRFEPPTIEDGNRLYTDLLAFRAKNKELGKYCFVSITQNHVGRFVDLSGVRKRDEDKTFDTPKRLEILRGFEDFVRAYIKEWQARVAAQADLSRA